MSEKRPRFLGAIRQVGENLSYILKLMWGAAPLFLVLTLLSSLISGLGNVAQSLFISRIVDGVIAGKAFGLLAMYAGVILLFQLLEKIHGRTLFALNRVVTEKISLQMERGILSRVEKISLTRMDAPGFLNRMEQARNLTKRTPNSVFMMLFGAAALIACSVLLFIANNRYEENVTSFLFAMSPQRRRMEYLSELLLKRESYEEVHAYGAVGYLRGEYEKNANAQIGLYPEKRTMTKRASCCRIDYNRRCCYMRQKYTNVQSLIGIVRERKAAGETYRKIAESLGLTLNQVKALVWRENRRDNGKFFRNLEN